MIMTTENAYLLTMPSRLLTRAKFRPTKPRGAMPHPASQRLTLPAAAGSQRTGAGTVAIGAPGVDLCGACGC